MSENKPCRACDHPRETTGRSAVVRTAWSAMKAQASLGCVPCAILSEGVEKALHGEQSQTGDNEDWQLRLDFNMQGSTSLNVLVLGTDIVLCFFCSEVTPWLSKTLPDLPVAIDVPPRTSSPESLTWLCQQIQECTASHASCTTSVLFRQATGTEIDPPKRFPKRVIDVQSTLMRLFEPSELIRAPYICLSHVWGERPFLQTTVANYSSHKKEIAYDKLPPTFQDAVDYTRKLGIAYLWIDSLCIIQDDEDDWRVEAAQMSSIYHHSHLVLSAAKSPNAYGGLFAEFPSRCKTHTVLISPRTTGASSRWKEEIHVRRSLTHLNSQQLIRSISSPRSKDEELASFLPALTRGWIFQERFLAPRIVHFGPEEVTFECFHTSICQCSPPQRPTQSLNTKSHGQWYYDTISRIANPKSYHSFYSWRPEEILVDHRTNRWHHLVEDYTKLMLTYERDIFPALSGLTMLMATVPNLRAGNQNFFGLWYLAGLWSVSLHRDLLWRVRDYDDHDYHHDPNNTTTIPRRRPRKWRAPSWSWASVTGPVEFLDQTEVLDSSRCAFLDAHYALAGQQPYGELADVGARSNFLALRGLVIPVVATIRREKRNSWEVLELDVFKGHLRNVWVDDIGHWLGQDKQDSEQGHKLLCLLVGIKKTKALCFLVLRDTRGDLTNPDTAALAKGFAGSPASQLKHGSTEDNTNMTQGTSVPGSSLADKEGRVFMTVERTNCDGILQVYQRVGVAEVFGGPPGPGWWAERLLALGEEQVIKII